MKKNKRLMVMEFVSFCIEQYKRKMHQTGQQVLALFEQYGVIPFLINNYDILHTQNAQLIQDEVERFINSRRI